jgi:hypothetical protein
MSDPELVEPTPAVVPFLPAGADTEGAQRGLGVSTVQFKVAGRADLLVLENTFHARGGPARHLHLEQDEWFYALESEFVLEVGDQRFHLHAGTRSWPPGRCLTCGHTSGRDGAAS